MSSITQLFSHKPPDLRRFYGYPREVAQADDNAARNVLERVDDPEIGRWTTFKKVKTILQARTERYRLELINQDFSCVLKNAVSTESELLLEYV